MMTQILAAGTTAPSFTQRVTPDQNLSLNELKGGAVILAFYPADWSGVCGGQLALYNEVLPEFRKHGADLLGISVDRVWCHEDYVQARRLHFPLLTDFNPKGAVARDYGAYREGEGVCERALLVLDRNGVIFWSAVNPGADGILEALESPSAEAAAESAEFANAYGRFWDMHDSIFENPDRLGLPVLFELASALGLSEAGLREALVNGTCQEKVKSDFLGGVRSGVNGTPSFIINDRRHDPSYAFEDLASAVEANLHLKVML